MDRLALEEVRGSREFRVSVPGFRVQSSGFRVQGSGFRVQSSGFRVQGSGFRVQGLGSDRLALQEVRGSREAERYAGHAACHGRVHLLERRGKTSFWRSGS